MLLNWQKQVWSLWDGVRSFVLSIKSFMAFMDDGISFTTDWGCYQYLAIDWTNNRTTGVVKFIYFWCHVKLCCPGLGVINPLAMLFGSNSSFLKRFIVSFTNLLCCSVGSFFSVSFNWLCQKADGQFRLRSFWYLW